MNGEAKDGTDSNGELSPAIPRALLIVDDDQRFCDRLARAMERRGFEVRTAYTVSDGLALARQLAPGYAVVDLRLDDGSGLDVVQALREGKHDNSVVGVANKDYEAAAVANSVMNRMFDRGVVSRDQVRTIYKSQTFPTTGYGHAHNLDPRLVAKIKQAFFTFEWAGSALQEEFQKEGRFVAIYHKSDWEVIRKIDAANGVEYSCK